MNSLIEMHRHSGMSWYPDGMLAAILNSTTELFQRGLDKRLGEEIKKIVKT